MYAADAMKEKHIRVRIEQCLALAKASNCPRRKFGALLLDPTRNVPPRRHNDTNIIGPTSPRLGFHSQC